MPAPVDQTAIDRLFRHESGRAVAALTRRFGDLDLAEESVQEAFIEALKAWPRDGLPVNPGAWIMTVARNRALDLVRRDKVGDEKIAEVARSMTHYTEIETLDSKFEDDRLRLIFMCCHPALSPESQVGLTLKMVAGLSVEAIASAFIVHEATMAQRLVRAKKKVRETRIAFKMPDVDRLDDRMGSVLAVIYFIFNEGYSANAGDSPVRAELCDEALWLGRLLRSYMPDHSELTALLALMLLQDSRRAARADGDGAVVLLKDQDRSLWNRAKIKEGMALLESVWDPGRAGPYAIQAALAAKHAVANSEEDTDWAGIVELYAALSLQTPNPVLDLNRAVALAMANGPAAGLTVIDELSGGGMLDGYPPLHLARADLLRRAGRNDESIASYRRALELVTNASQREFIAQQISDQE